MEELLLTAVGYLKLAVEAVGAAILGFGALATIVLYLLSVFGIRKRPGESPTGHANAGEKRSRRWFRKHRCRQTAKADRVVL